MGDDGGVAACAGAGGEVRWIPGSSPGMTVGGVEMTEEDMRLTEEVARLTAEDVGVMMEEVAVSGACAEMMDGCVRAASAVLSDTWWIESLACVPAAACCGSPLSRG